MMAAGRSWARGRACPIARSTWIAPAIVGGALIAVAVSALLSGGAGSTPAPPSPPPPAAEKGSPGSAAFYGDAAAAPKVRRHIAGAELAVGLTFDARGRLLYAEKDSGRIVRAERGRRLRTLARLRVAGGGEAGLLGLAAAPDGTVYASYTSPDAGCPRPVGEPSSGVAAHCVWRLRPARRGTRLVPDGRVFSAGHPSEAENHVGGGLHLGPDGALYYSIGDLGENDDPDRGPGRAQDLTLPFGKLLRLDPAGDNKAGAGNPGACGNVANDRDRAAVDDRIWACGLRNTYEFAFGADGRLWGSEAGDGCDEINLLRAGVNYGWEPPRTDCAGQGAGRPYKKTTGTPAGIGVWTSRKAGGWRGDVFFCANSDGGKLRRLDVTTRRLSTVGAAGGRCALDLEPGPDGALYFSDYGAIYRLTR